MTRINIGIAACELCDQHLVAEYRELPRMRAMALDRLQRYGGPGPRPERPTLGAGHMAYFLPFGIYLRHHWIIIKREMIHRGMSPTLEWRDYPAELAGDLPPPDHIDEGRKLLQARIVERLATMARATWTRRARPSWAGG